MHLFTSIFVPVGCFLCIGLLRLPESRSIGEQIWDGIFIGLFICLSWAWGFQTAIHDCYGNISPFLQ